MFLLDYLVHMFARVKGHIGTVPMLLSVITIATDLLLPAIVRMTWSSHLTAFISDIASFVIAATVDISLDYHCM